MELSSITTERFHAAPVQSSRRMRTLPRYVRDGEETWEIMDKYTREPLGWISMHLDHERHGDRGVYIEHSYRNNGIYQEVMPRWDRWFFANFPDRNVIRLVTAKVNAAMQHVLEKLGYNFIGEAGRQQFWEVRRA